MTLVIDVTLLEEPVPMLDVCPPAGLLAPQAQNHLRQQLLSALLTAEGAPEAAGDPALAGRTWVTLTEATEGGWGASGFALGKDEFAALRAGR